jgi:hypothetical protein
MGAFLISVNSLRYFCGFKGRGTALLWLILSLSYLVYLHGAWYAADQFVLITLFSVACKFLTRLSPSPWQCCLHSVNIVD